MVSLRKTSGTMKLAKLHLRRAIQLLRVAEKITTCPSDVYRALGLASELIDDADQLVCSLPDSLVIGPQRTFEELTGKPAIRKASAA